MSQGNTYRKALLDLLALEYTCSPSAFSGSENILTHATLREGRRAYDPDQHFFRMVTLGDHAVITAHACLHPFLREFMKDRMGIWLFEQSNLPPLMRELERFGYGLSMSWHQFLPALEVATRQQLEVRWMNGEEMDAFLSDDRFSNALCGEGTTRPHRMAVCALDGENIMGIAGCSEDAPGWFQIGVDVLPAYRSRGVGTYLVTLLKNRLIGDGVIPFYGTSLSNLHSWNLALNCGFRPAWVEMWAEKQ